MKLSFEIIEAKLMHEINQLKAMIYILLPNKPANYQYNTHSYASPYNQPAFHQSIYPINAASPYEEHTRQTTYGSQNSNQPSVSDNIQPTNIPQMQHPTTMNNPFTMKPTNMPVIEKRTTTVPVTTTEPPLHETTTQVPEIKSPTVSGVKEKILEFKPVQTKSLRSFRSKNNK